MKKVLVFCLLTVFSAFYSASTWGNDVYTGGPSITVTVSSTTITVSGTGAMDDKTASFNDLWATHKTVSGITSIVINEGVTHIGAYVFNGFSHITSVTIPASVTSIGAKAFNSCSGMTNFYFGGTPAQWASVDLLGDVPYNAHPLGAISSTGTYHFYGLSATTTTLFIEPTIEEIKKYTFYRGSFTTVCIPGTVKNIRQGAFHRSTISSELIVNNSSAPSLGTNAIPALAKNLYVPSSNSGYTSSPWSSYTLNTCSTSGTLNAANGSLPWSLSEAGVLTIDATSKATKSIPFDIEGSSHPWGMFRRMVYKIVIKGEMTNIGYLGRYHYGLSEIILDQTTIPTSTADIALNGSAYAGLFNKRDKLTLSIKPASLTDESVTNLASTPWSDGSHWNVSLSETVSIADDVDNSTLLNNIHTYIDLPFTMQFIRSLTNASYNTFCSPIPLTAAQLDGADIRALESTTYDDGSEELYLNFSSTPLSAVEAGVPYLIRPSSTISNPTFTDVDPGSVVVDPETVETSEVDFHGVLKPTTLTGGDKSILFLGAGNELFWPATTGDIKGLRAYFEIKEGSGARRAIRARMNMDGHSTPTNLESVQPSAISSQKVLRDGQLYIMHNGQMYDVQGRRVQ